jgi:hypothetical protein
MAVPPREPSLRKEQRQALALLASIPHGITEDLLVLAHGFDRTMIAGLVDEGLAEARIKIVTVSRHMTMARVTDAGRMALES